MDDYNSDLLAEAKNEYTCRLVTILSPLIIEGVKSIFKEAYKLWINPSGAGFNKLHANPRTYALK